MVGTFTVLHETRNRLRLHAERADAEPLQAALASVIGVQDVRASPAARSVTLKYDGRAATREAIVNLVRRSTPVADLVPRRRRETLPVSAPLVAAALAPALPRHARPAIALGLVAAKAARTLKRGGDMTAAALESVALATTALTGHPLSATTSILLSAVAERRRNSLLQQTDRLLTALAPAEDARYAVRRGGEGMLLAADALCEGDRLVLDVGAVVPTDGIVLAGHATALNPLSMAPTDVTPGKRLAAGARVLNGQLTLRAERRAELSRSARLRDHVRHILRTRDEPGSLTPDLERVAALPMTAAGLVLAMTGDAARTAAMLQADPQLGISLAHPVAREAALFATARSGALLAGLQSIERLAAATTFAFEDIGVLAERFWVLERVVLTDPRVTRAQASHWLARLAGHHDTALLAAGVPDVQLAAWREHGALLRDGDRVLHFGGAARLTQVWGLALPEFDRRSLVRRLGVVEDGRLLATLHFTSRLHEGVANCFAALRALGVRSIAVFTEDPTAQPAHALTKLGADAIVSSDRQAQRRWLDEAVERGEKVALVHTGLRDLLPPGGLSLCPIDAESGAHGVLLGDPMPALVAARASAIAARNAVRRQFGLSVSLNAALMVVAAMRWIPPIATTLIRHGLVFLLLQQSAALTRHVAQGSMARDADSADDTPVSPSEEP